MMALANKATRILCVNCNICVNNLRRYSALGLNTRVTALLCNWVYPQIIEEDDVVCDTCLQLARAAVNETIHGQDSSGNQGTSSLSRPARTDVCLICGCSTARKQRCPIIRSNCTEMQQSIINIIQSRLEPQQISHSSHVCMACWLRTKREVERSSHQDQGRIQPEASNNEQEGQLPMESNELSHSSEVVLPNYKRAANTSNHCVFPNCRTTTLHTISNKLRALVLSNHNYYLPPRARVCYSHLISNTWDTLYEASTSLNTFSIEHIEDVFSFVNTFNPTLDFENLQDMDDRVFEYWMGCSKSQFNELLEDVPQVMEIKRGTLGLAAFLLKMRTGDSDERISSLLQVPRRTLEFLIDKIRDILTQVFVPMHIGINSLTRSELISHGLTIPKGLYGHNNAIVICDGTYIYINKSANYSFQKQTYSLHKYRNLLKPYLIVACDGYIVDCFGPYKATTSDSVIMNNLFRDENCPLRLYFRPNDTFILDRGFRDSITLLEQCGYKPCMPETLLQGHRQLTTAQANRSRCVTICRWVVEVVNGYIKRDFKLLRQEYFHRALPRMMDNFRIAVALINKFGVRLQDNEYAIEMLNIINERLHFPNNLANMVDTTNMNRRSANFNNITAEADNIFFPRLEYKELILFAVGTYQIRQARSYYGEHVRFHGRYVIEVCSESINSSEFNLRGNNTTLIRGKIRSRHISRRQYYVYVLIENNRSGREGIVEYCCSCLVGRRTVGCCAHTMTIVWYLGWARHENNISAPAEFLDSIFIRDDSDNEE